MAQTYHQIASKLRSQQKRRDQGLHAPFISLVSANNPERDRMKVTYHGGERIIRTYHPFLSNSAWFRGSPDVGVGAILSYRSDTGEPESTGYYVIDPERRVQAFLGKANDGKAVAGDQVGFDPYRILQPGEFEVHSRGFAQIFWGRRAHQDLRAGLARRWMDQDKLECADKAPIHRRIMHTHESTTVKDEERLGVIKRPRDGSSPNFEKYVKIQGEYAKEYLLRLNFQSNPATMVNLQMGHVVDDVDQQVQQSVTGINLRYLMELFTIDETEVKIEVDEKGNYKIELPQEAEDGGRLIIPNGFLRETIEMNREIIINRDRIEEIAIDSKCTIGNDQTYEIGNDDTILVKNDREITIENDLKQTVKGDAEYLYEGDKTEKIEGDYDLEIVGDFTMKVTGESDYTYEDNVTRDIMGDYTDTILGTIMETWTGDYTSTITGTVTNSIIGDVINSIIGNLTETLVGDLTKTITGDVTYTITGDYTRTMTGTNTLTAASHSVLGGPMTALAIGATTLLAGGFVIAGGGGGPNLETHTHSDVTTGTADSGPPNPGT